MLVFFVGEPTVVDHRLQREAARGVRQQRAPHQRQRARVQLAPHVGRRRRLGAVLRPRLPRRELRVILIGTHPGQLCNEKYGQIGVKVAVARLGSEGDSSAVVNQRAGDDSKRAARLVTSVP